MGAGPAEPAENACPFSPQCRSSAPKGAGGGVTARPDSGRGVQGISKEFPSKSKPVQTFSLSFPAFSRTKTVPRSPSPRRSEERPDGSGEAAQQRLPIFQTDCGAIYH